MQANYVQRLRIVFRKSGPTRYIGHLDVARTLLRTINRARVPIAFTQGYNPRPRMQIAAALPLGVSGDRELADIWLTEDAAPIWVKERMVDKQPPGIEIRDIYEVALTDPPMQNITTEAHYEATVPDKISNAELQQRVDELLAADTMMRQRKEKLYDLRPLILNIDVLAEKKGNLGLQFQLRHEPGWVGRPDELLLELGLDALTSRINRQQIVLGDLEPQGRRD